MTDDRKLISHFLSLQNLMVISSVTREGDPQAAVVEFAETESLEIIFDTYVHFRKLKNLKANSSVALVFDDRASATVQYEGVVRELTSPELEPYLSIYLKKLPDAVKFV